MSSTPENSDPYLYPGTSVLRNLRGLTDPEQLERFEARRTHQRIAELIDNPLVGGFASDQATCGGTPRRKDAQQACRILSIRA